MIRHLYVHVPFCPRICPYCSFFVVPADRRRSRPFVDAVLAELRTRTDSCQLQLETIYLGGGTPSALTTEDLERLIAGIMAHCSCAPREFTIEANPTTLSREKAQMLRRAGVNRVSLGAQSFDPAVLTVLGRQHAPDRIRATWQIVREAGFDNLGLDLIFGVPGQGRASWLTTLREAVELKPEHLSAYSLTFEEDTPFFEKLQFGELAKNAEDDEWMFRTTGEVLAEAGLHRYEISNFAREGFASRHNSAYWRGSDFLGIGPGAVSTVSGRRWRNSEDLGHYMSWVENREPAHSEEEHLDAATLAKERWIFGIRTSEGVAGSEADPAFAPLREAGLAVHRDGRWILTDEGLLRADAVAVWLM